MITPKRQVFKLSDINPAPYNPRTITEESLAGLSESLKKFGYLQPIIVNVHNEGSPIIIGGHQRLKAMEMQGVDEVECVVVDFDEVTERAANVALNNQHTSGGWDFNLLAPLLEELSIEMPDFNDLKFDTLQDGIYNAEDVDIDGFFEDEYKKDDPTIYKLTLEFPVQLTEAIESKGKKELAELIIEHIK